VAAAATASRATAEETTKPAKDTKWDWNCGWLRVHTSVSCISSVSWFSLLPAMMRLIASVTATCLFLSPTLAAADGPADNIPDNVRRVPKLGIEVPTDKRQELEAGLKELRSAIDDVRQKNLPQVSELLPDVEIFYKSVHDALVYQEFFDPKELDEAIKQLAAGKARAAELAGLKPNQKPSWATETGLVVRGYVSKIDGSVQPYGLVVPESYSAKGPARYRTDVWLHGRGETLSELNFLRDRMNNPGTFSPDDTIVLHPYGRYCNAFKFAGEIDVFEALDSVKRRYRVDEDKIAIRGFSMGGAGVWHLAVHYPDKWFAANPGAGFSETPEFLKVFQKEDLKPTWWEQKLWQLYDCPGWAANLKNLPTVAYSGELDSQKQAADIMVPALRKEAIELRHVIGPGTRHAYHPEAKEEVERRLAAIGNKIDNSLHSVLKTTTLRFNRRGGIIVDELQEHWAAGRIESDIHISGGAIVYVRVQNISGFTLDFMPGETFGYGRSFELAVHDAQHGSGDWDDLSQSVKVGEAEMQSDGAFRVSAHKSGNSWKLGPRPDDGKLKKKHGLQGPIDDAFLDSFIFVRPTGKSQHEMAGKWSASELDRAIEHWRRHFRGNARVKDDSKITDPDIAAHNLVLWGDPASNSVLAKVADKLPIKWGKEQIVVDDGRKYAADKHALIAIYPNPLNPSKYLVLNSSFTFREYAYLNNARQVPMLPDWAVVDLTTPPNSVWPGKISAADFFDEKWQLKPPGPR
jgi:dienelactone hydrolase